MSSVKVIGELKKRRLSPSFTPAEEESVIAFAIQWLTEEAYRPHIIVYLTDLYYIQFFKVPNAISPFLNSFTFGDYSPSNVYELAGRGQLILASLLTSDDFITGFPSAILKPVSFSGNPAYYSNFIGRGNTAVVFELKIDSHIYALKICNTEDDASLELSNLKKLWDAIDKLPNKKKLFFEDVITTLIPPKDSYVISDEKYALRIDWLGESPFWDRYHFSNLVKYLQLIHECGFVHRDIAPNNLIYYKDSIVAIDYCSLCTKNKRTPFHGTAAYASFRILDQLKRNDIVVFTPQDDLISLIRTAFSFLVSDQTQFFNDLNETNLYPAQLDQFWTDKLGLKKPPSFENRFQNMLFKPQANLQTPSLWQRLEDHAIACDYDNLIYDFVNFLRL